MTQTRKVVRHLTPTLFALVVAILVSFAPICLAESMQGGDIKLTAIGKVEEKLVDAIRGVDYEMAGNIGISNAKVEGTVLLVTEARDATGKPVPRLKGKQVRLLRADARTVASLTGKSATVQGILKNDGAIEVLSIAAYSGSPTAPQGGQKGQSPSEPLKSKGPQPSAKFEGTIASLSWQAGLPISPSTWKETIIRLKEYPDHAFYMSAALSKKHGFEPPGVLANIQADKLTGTRVRMSCTAMPPEAGKGSSKKEYRVVTYDILK